MIGVCCFIGSNIWKFPSIIYVSPQTFTLVVTKSKNNFNLTLAFHSFKNEYIG